MALLSTPDTIVVGGGFAGLSAAAMLAEAGARVALFDARPQLGGRATAFRDRATGELVDNGQHVLFGCYRATFEFLRRVGAEHNVRLQPSLRVPYLDRDGRRSELRCRSLPAPLNLLSAVLGWEALPWRDRLSVLRLALPLRAARRALERTGRVGDGEGSTVSEFLRRHRQGEKLTGWLWEPLAVAALNQSPAEAQAAPFVRVLAEMFGSDPIAAAIGLPTRPLNQMYAEPTRDYVERRGGSVATGSVAKVIVEGGRVRGVEVHGERLSAGRVIAAVPWHTMRSLFAGEPPAAMAQTVAAAAAMASKPIVTVTLWYDRRVMDEPFVGLPDRAMQWVFDKRLAFGDEASHLSLVASGADLLVGRAEGDLVAHAAREVASALPAARAARLIRGTVIRERQATFSLAAGQPPRPATRTGVDGLYLAGDWIDTGLPGTIESAVVSGHAAARAALEVPIDD